jgi:hypothetical protein
VGNINRIASAFTDLTDTPASITPDAFVRGNGAGSALVFFDLFGSANSWTATQTFRNIAADIDGVRNIGTGSVRFRSMRGQILVGTVGNGAVTFPAAGQGGAIFGRSEGVGASVDLGTTASFPPIMLAGNAYAAAATAVMSHQAGGGSMLGSSYAITGSTTISSDTAAYGCFIGGYAFQSAGAGASNLTSLGAGSFLWAYVAGTGTGTAQAVAGGAGCFVSGRVQGSGAHTLRGDGPGSFVQGLILGTPAGLIESTTAGGGAFVQGRANNGGSIRSTANGAFAQGNVNNGVGDILASGRGAFAQGDVSTTGLISASGIGSIAHGAVTTGTISATATGSGAFGDAGTSTISATASNAFQFGVGTNATANSIQVGADFQARANGQFGGANDALTLGAGATTFAATSSLMTITGNAGTNTIATITGGLNGQRLTLIFTDALVTITDDNSHAANTIDLSAPFVSADDAVLDLVFDGTSWYEVSRSVN